MNKKIIDAFSLILSALLIATLVCSFVGACRAAIKGEYGVFDYIFVAACIVTSIFGLYYIFNGCKKANCGKYYVWFMGALAVCEWISIAQSVAVCVWCALTAALSVATVTVLCFAKDLGQTKSLALAIIALASQTVSTVVSAVILRAYPYSSVNASVLAGTALFMVCAKYYDKHTRGSK